MPTLTKYILSDSHPQETKADVMKQITEGIAARFSAHGCPRRTEINNDMTTCFCSMALYAECVNAI